MTEKIDAFADKLKRAYGKRWLAQAAELLGVHPTTVWRWATGRINIPKSALLAVQGLKLTRRPKAE
jgi:DNA-binding transcriptional regulator YdaS (Cro superfamily)